MTIHDYVKENVDEGTPAGIKFRKIISDAYSEMIAAKKSSWNMNVKDFAVFNETLLALPDKEKVLFCVFAFHNVYLFQRDNHIYSSIDKAYRESMLTSALLNQLFKTKMEFDDEDIGLLAESFYSFRNTGYELITWHPASTFLTQLARQTKTKQLSPQSKKTLSDFKIFVDSHKSKTNEKELLKLSEKIDSILFNQEHGHTAIKPIRFSGEDRLADFANTLLDQQPEPEKIIWYKLITLTKKTSGSKPSAKYTEECKILFKDLGAEKFKKIVNSWIVYVKDLRELIQEHAYTDGNGRVHNYSTTEFLSQANLDVLKGFVWMCVHFHDSETLKNLAGLAERSFKKIPGKGPTAAALGNACIYVLFKTKGLEGIGHLSRLKLRIKQNSTQGLIEKYLQEAAISEGVSVHEIEDMAAEDFDLIKGEREYDFDGFKARIQIKKVGKVELNWFKPDGSPQKSIPASVKDKYGVKLKKIKNTLKQIDITLTAQRDRADRMFRVGRKMSLDKFRQFYLNHGLMNFISEKLIWTFESPTQNFSAINIEGKWLDADGTEYVLSEDAQVFLWHPSTSDVKTIKQWRDFLTERKIVQPLKQAYREVYLLTDAEVKTASYSNRMAAHVLKQHQFNSLAKTRGWKYALLGAYDNGINNETASLNLPEWNIRAEFWVNELNADDAFNDTGIWNYITTDQVRFVNAATNEPLELVNVPPVQFSEVMRDVDLFVGVSSVGNDPSWQDNGGVPAYRDYWQSYSFGELSEMAKTRKEILSNLIPRLKISTVSEIKDKFLIVKGKIRTYKIHIGSTNILMEPNDQYLCIVPDRSQKNHTENIFLPFEGDTGLSIILSKAFLLAEDDKIKDPTIISQIGRK